MNFLDRQREVNRLSSIWDGVAGRQSFGVVYGRRRCGKSTLLRRLQRPGDVYFLAIEGEAALQRQLLAQALARKFPAFDAVNYTDYTQLFTVLKSRVTEPFTLTIDEFSYLVRSDASLPSILQQVMDVREAGQFNLVLCGSSQQMMHRTVLSGTAPLYGRADEIIHVRPLPAGWLMDAQPNQPAEALIAEYAIWGGVPRYWEIRSRYADLKRAIIGGILEPTAPLHDEPRRLLLDDLTQLPQPISILAMVAQGVHRLSEMGGRLQKPANELYRPIKRLIALGYLRKEYPYGASPRKSKTVLYRLSDPFLAFYYRFVLPNTSQLSEDLIDMVWDRIDAELPRYVADFWEELCRSTLRRGGYGRAFEPMRRWWGRGTDGRQMEIDGLAVSLDGKRILALECKWSVVNDEQRLRSQLREKVSVLPLYRGQEIVTVIGGRSFKTPPAHSYLDPSAVLATLRY
jgi:AAA+ ATPase superfamily predicted ATPase